MKNGYKLGLSLLVLVILVIGLIQAGQKEPVNWEKSFSQKEKTPFGTYVLRNELKTIFPQNKSILDVKQSFYAYTGDSLQQLKNEDFIFIGWEFDQGTPSVKRLLQFVANGNKAFLAAYDFPEKLKDTLNFAIAGFNEYLAGVDINHDSVYWELAGNKASVYGAKASGPEFFDSLNSGNATILGYLREENVRVPNFVSIKFGKGTFYLQTNPEIYTNYFILNKKGFPIAYSGLKNLSGEKILWMNHAFEEDISGSPLRFILSQPALRYSWYLLLLTLVLFMIFKSRREQAAIPIVEKERNLSVEFAETIGSLYFENGNPGNVGTKKIDYFLYDLKRNYYFDRIAPEDPGWRVEAASRLGMPIREIETFFGTLSNFQRNPPKSIDELKQLQNLIEDFKQRINHD